MFGILYTLAVSIGGIASGIKASFQNDKGIQQGILDYEAGRNIAYTYFDRKGIQRDIKTHQIATIRPDYEDMCDDKWLWLGAPSVKTRNISEEQRKIDFEKCKNSNWFNRTVDIYDNRDWATSGSNKYKTIIHGAFYKDLTTGQMFVCRKFFLYVDDAGVFHWCNNLLKTQYICKFYMGVKSGKLIRKADTQIEDEKKNSGFVLDDTQAEEFIRQFNTEQKRGGWYKGGCRYNSATGEILNRQNYYCNDFADMDHIVNLLKLNEQKNNKYKARTELQKELRNL